MPNSPHGKTELSCSFCEHVVETPVSTINSGGEQKRPNYYSCISHDMHTAVPSKCKWTKQIRTCGKSETLFQDPHGDPTALIPQISNNTWVCTLYRWGMCLALGLSIINNFWFWGRQPWRKFKTLFSCSLFFGMVFPPFLSLPYLYGTAFTSYIHVHRDRDDSDTSP